MDPLHRKALRQCRTLIKEELYDVMPVLNDTCIIFSNDELDAIASRTTRTDQADVLLRILDTKGTRAYPTFRKSLNRRYPKLGEALDVIVAKDIGEKYGLDVSQGKPSIGILSEAIEIGYHSAVKDLIDHNVAFHNRWYGLTPLETACMFNRETTAVLLFEKGAIINSGMIGGSNALHYACANNSVECAVFVLSHLHASRISINAKDRDGNTALHHACSAGNPVIIEKLLTHGAEINIKNSAGETPLHKAAVHRDTTCAKLLCRKNANVNAIGGSDHETPLHVACKHNSERMIKLLLDGYGADPNVQNRFRRTPMHLVFREGHARALEAMMLNGVPNLRIQDDDNWTVENLAQHLEEGEFKTVWDANKEFLEMKEKIHSDSRPYDFPF